MMWKWFGAMLVIAGCGTVGFSMAWTYKREERLLRNLKRALYHISCELQYHLTPLPELCRQVLLDHKNPIGQTFGYLAMELDKQMLPDVEDCMNHALQKTELSKRPEEALRLLGQNLGRFDLDGQLKGIEMVRDYCDKELEAMGKNREERLRSYQTLGLCAGAALAILFV